MAFENTKAERGTVASPAVDPAPVTQAAAAPKPSDAPSESKRTRTPTWMQGITGRYALVMVWAAMALFYYLMMPDTFGSIGAVRQIFGGQPVLVFLAMSALITLVVAEFDLSIASTMGMSATVVSVLAGVQGVNIWLACLVALAASAIAGAVNAFFVVGMGVHSMVVTLGTGTLMVGLSQWMTGGNVVSYQDEVFSSLVLKQVLGMPVSFYYGLAVAILFAYILGHTPLGRYMLFVGSNQEVARLAGVRVNAIRVGAYVVSAVVAGFAGIVIISSLGGFDPTSSSQFLLPALAAVFLGTTVVIPGQFNPLGMMIAIWFLWTGIFGLQLMGVAGWVQNAFYGGGLVAAVALSKLVRDRSSARA